jgi:hypothetical protein
LTLQYGINLARKSIMKFEKKTTTADKNYRRMPKIIFTNNYKQSTNHLAADNKESTV